MGNQNWATPPWLFEAMNTRFGPFDLDVCASPENAKCARFLDEQANGLTSRWSGRCFCNPPFSSIPMWLERGMRAVDSGECSSVTFVLPAATDTKWFRNIADKMSIYFVVGRVQFVEPPGIDKKRSGNTSGTIIATYPTYSPMMRFFEPKRRYSAAQEALL